MKVNFPYSPQASVPDFDKLKDQLMMTLDSLPKAQGGTVETRISAMGALEGDRAIWHRALAQFEAVNHLQNVNPSSQKLRDAQFEQKVQDGLQNIDDSFFKANPDLDPNYKYSQAFMASRMTEPSMKSFYSPEESQSPYRHVVSLLGNSGQVWKDVSKETYQAIQSDSQPIKDTERFLNDVKDTPQQRHADLVDNFNSGKFDGIY